MKYTKGWMKGELGERVETAAAKSFASEWRSREREAAAAAALWVYHVI